MRYNDINPEFLVNTNRSDNAYFLGRLWADGSMGIYHISLECLDEDLRELLPYLDDMGIYTIYSRQRYRDGGLFGRKQGVVKLSSKTLVKVLKGWGYDRKSVTAPTKVLASIPSHLHCHFWRGYLDGDGCVYVKSRPWRLTFWGTIDQDWSQLTDMYTRLGVVYSTTRYIRKEGRHQSSMIEVRQIESLKKALDYIYQGYEKDGIGLKRKWEKYQELCAKKVRVCKRYQSPGINYLKTIDKWHAYIGKSERNSIKRQINLGNHPTEADACKAREAYVKKHELTLIDSRPSKPLITYVGR